MGNLTRHADPGGAVGDVRGEEVPVRSDDTRGPVVSVVEEGDTGGVPHGRPNEPGGRRAQGHQAGLAERRLPPAGRGRRHRGTPRRSRRGPPRGDIRNRQSVHRHTSLLPPVAAVAHPVGTPPMPTNDTHVAGPQLALPGRRPRFGSGCGRRRCAPRAPVGDDLEEARVGAASGTRGRGRPRSGALRRRRPARRNHPRGRASSRTRACSAAVCSTAEVATSVAAGPASGSEVAEPRPQGPCAALAG